MKSKSLLLLALLMAGCQSLRAPAPPVCDGRHRRPANPPITAPAQASPRQTTPAPAAAAAKAAGGPPQPNAESLKPCGGRP